jgi:hypothetical protein
MSQGTSQRCIHSTTTVTVTVTVTDTDTDTITGLGSINGLKGLGFRIDQWTHPSPNVSVYIIHIDPSTASGIIISFLASFDYLPCLDTSSEKGLGSRIRG